eukprot:scaffold148606_cov21-Tisochrysis_lutea.AAC.2
MQAHAVLGLAHMLAHIPVHAGQNVSMIDSLFTGGYLGSQSDIADGSLRNEEFRSVCQPSHDGMVSYERHCTSACVSWEAS